MQVWDLQEGVLFYTLHGHEGPTLGATFSPAGDHFASSGADQQVVGAGCWVHGDVIVTDLPSLGAHVIADGLMSEHYLEPVCAGDGVEDQL